MGLRELGRAGGHVGVPDWNKVAGRRVERGRHRLEHAAAEDTVEGAHHVQERGNHAADGAKVLGEEVGARVCGPLVLELALADRLDELAGVDPDGALHLAHAIGRAGAVTFVGEVVEELIQPLLLSLRAAGDGLQAGDLAVDGDALPRGEAQVAAGAVALAEAALHAHVHDGIRHGLGLEELLVRIRVTVEDDARVEHVVGVEELLELPHQVVSLLAPLHLDERRHVASSAVLSLERSAVLHRDNLAHLLHHRGVLLNLLVVPETLGEHEVKVTLERVAHAGRVLVAEPLEHVDEVLGHVAELVNLAGDVLDEHGGSRGPRGADEGDETLAHVPVHLVHRLVLVERVGGLAIVEVLHIRVVHGVAHLLDAGVELRVSGAAALDKERRAGPGSVGDGGHEADDLLVTLALGEGRAIEELDRVDLGLPPEHRGGAARLLDILEDDESGRLVGVVDHGVVGGLGDEAQGALGSDHQPLDDLDGIGGGEVHERVHGVPGGALDGVLLLDERGELLVSLHAAGERDDAVDEALVRLEERLAARLVAGIEHGAVDKHDPHVLKGVVRVLLHAAAHSGRVVGDDAADHARIDGGRVGAHLILLLDAVLLLVLGQQAVHLAEDQTGFDRDLFSLVLRVVVERVGRSARVIGNG